MAARRADFTTKEKLRIFSELFRGRIDVYPVRWENPSRGTAGYMPDCSNKFVRPLCDIRRVKCSQCKNQAFKPLDDAGFERHLRGKQTIGVYPLLPDGRCWFLALDFDDANWAKDVRAVHRACATLNLPAYIERSRSGAGAHLWLFFSEPIPAMDARALGRHILAQAQDRNPTLNLRSYDRMFPSQDAVKQGGFGNLIALPLQRAPRQEANSVFLDHEFQAYPDQWTLLAEVERISPKRLARLLSERADDTSRARTKTQEGDAQTGDLFERVNIATRAANAGTKARVAIRDRIYVERAGLPSTLQTKIRDLAMFSNPEYFRRKAVSASTWKTPRVIRCSEVTEHHVVLPRGCEHSLRELSGAEGSEVEWFDRREMGSPNPLSFRGTLTPLQQEALAASSAPDRGVLVLPTGVGKTAVACALIAERSTTTLILVNRKPLLDQWRAQLEVFLGVSESAVGQLGGRKSMPSGKIDLATVQSLSRGDFKEALKTYGFVIVDECHHAAARSVESVLSQVPAKYLLGLTATPKRRDGHHPIMHMQLGPVLFEVSQRLVASLQPFSHRFFVRKTELAPASEPENLAELQARLSQDERRNSFILDDTIAAIRDDRSPIILCQRQQHVLWFAERLQRYAENLFVLTGGLGQKTRKANLDALRALSKDEQRVVVATGSFIGEGFDDPRLDTLLLAAPISWRGMLAQYVGRLHRQHPGKDEVWVFDYVDSEVPELAKMFQKRATGYRALGYTEGEPPSEFELMADPAFDAEVLWDEPWEDVI